VSSIDQSLDELHAVDGLARRLKTVVRDVRVLMGLTRSAPALARFVLAAARNVPRRFTSTREVRAVAELLEPSFFEAYVRLEAVRASALEDRDSDRAEGDLACRIAYVDALTRQLHEHKPSRPPGTARERRAQVLAMLDSVDIPPEIRLVLHQARLLPVVMVMTEVPAAQRSPQVVQAAIREALDVMISFLLGLVRSPQPPPAQISGTLPDPMSIDELEARWRRVQAGWTGS
jgi:hypothetical protein